jgi:hypothetical protein
MLDCWDEFVQGVQSGCCSAYRKVKPGAKPWNGFQMERPKSFHEGLLFILEAPPAGSDHYFMKKEKDQTRDRLRKKFFTAFQQVSSAPKFSDFETFLEDFQNANCYLLPSFSYPCARKDGTNTSPTIAMAKHSGQVHLSIAVKCLRPRVIVLMGTRALAAGKAMQLVNEDLGAEQLHTYARLEPYHSTVFGFTITTFVTYWPMKRAKRENQMKELVNCYDGWLIPTMNESFKALGNP